MTNPSDIEAESVSLDKLRRYGEKFGIRFLEEVSLHSLVKLSDHKLPYQFAKDHLVLPFDERDGILQVGVCQTNMLDILEEVRHRLNQDIEEVLIPPSVLQDAIEICYRQKENEATEYIEGIATDGDKPLELEDENEYDLLAAQEGSKVVKILNMILLEALQQRASDIHFEPIEQGLVVRYRIDGVLQLRHRPPKDIQKQLITRIKVMAKLDIAEHRMPQDGRIKLRRGGKDVDFRVSTVPVVYGERVVLRILDKSNIMLDLADIGMEKELFKRFRSMIRENQGIILVTGPTGSGKTTTLYSAISDIQSPDTNIMTVEDPVEYKLAEIAQIGVNSKIGLSFSRGLRHILRQDPDVVLVGEIRDRETAEIAIQSSLTGHLVLSTLHTNDAPSAMTRLVDMGIEPYLLSSSVIGVLGQRLVRKICPHCKEAYQPSEEELSELGLPIESEASFYRGRGCDECFHVGYIGREAIYELLDVNMEVKQQLLVNPDANQLQQIAVRGGMKTMREAGIDKVLDGITTSSEVLRVTKRIKG